MFKMFKDYYKILGVSKDASRKTIHRAFAEIAMACHPDKTVHMMDLSPKQREERKEIFIAATEAHDVLANEAKRNEYDSEIERAKRSGSSYHTPPPRPRAAHERPTGAWQTPKPPPKPPPFSWDDVEGMISQRRYTPLFSFCANRWRDYDLRIKVGMRLIEHFVEHKSWRGLKTLNNTPGIPPEIRNISFERLAEVVLSSFSSDGFMAFLEMASDNTQDKETKLRSCMQVISWCSGSSRWHLLKALATHPGVPKEVSDAAYEKIPDLIHLEKNIKMVESFIEMSQERGRDESVRIRAGIKCVEACARQGQGDLILSIAALPGIPVAVRNAAFEKLPECMSGEALPKKIFEMFMQLIQENELDIDVRIRAGLKAVDVFDEKNRYCLAALVGGRRVPKEIRNAAYVKLAERIDERTDFKYFSMLLSMTADGGLDATVREPTGMWILNSACDHGWVHRVMLFLDGDGIPEILRNEAFKRLPILVAGQCDKNLLTEFVKRIQNCSQPPESKLKAYERFVEICVDIKEWERAIALIFSPGITEEVHKLLKERFQDAIEYKARQLAQEGHIGEFIELISNTQIPEVLRIDKGLKGVDLFSRLGMFKLLLKWGRGDLPGIPEKVQQGAIEKLALAVQSPEVADKLAAQKEHIFLLDLLKEEKVPLDCRKYAGLRMIDIASKEGEWGMLVKWSGDKTLPQGFSLACQENVSAALLNGKVVESYFKNKQYGHILTLVMDPNIPENIRECTGLSVVNCLEREFKYDLLAKLSGDASILIVPPAVKSAAREALTRASSEADRDLESRYGQVAKKMGDGLLDNGNVLPGKSKRKGKNKAPA